MSDKYGNSVYTSAVTSTLRSIVKITKQPINATGMSGSSQNMTVTASGDGLTYQWQYMKPQGSWTNSGMTGSKTATLGITLSSDNNGNSWRCKVSDKYGNSVYTDIVTSEITMNGSIKTYDEALSIPEPVISSQPQSIEGNEGETVNLCVGVEGIGLKYKWIFRKAGSLDEWKEIDNDDFYKGTDTDSINVRVSEETTAMEYRCVVMDNHKSSVESEIVKVTIKSGSMKKKDVNDISDVLNSIVNSSVTADTDEASVAITEESNSNESGT